MENIQDKHYKTIYNIAQAKLTNSEKRLLDKGLSFCPITQEPDLSNNTDAIHNLIRKIHLEAYFSSRDENLNQPLTPLQNIYNKYKPKSTWQPRRDDIPKPVLEYTSELKDRLLNAHKNRSGRRNNLTKKERTALNRLRGRNDIIIKAADKGAGTVIQTPEQYEAEITNQLDNKKYYRISNLEEYKRSIYNIRQTLRNLETEGLIDKKTKDLLIPEQHRPARFYTLPKIHKNIQQPPGRPIMSANNHPTERISELVDLFLKPHLSSTNSYIKDTNHFINITKELELEETDHIVTLDVSALYTNIPITEGLEALKTFLTKHYDNKTSRMVTNLAKLVLENNFFEFNGTMSLQTAGTAMGTRMAPSYAIIYMDNLETKLLQRSPIKPKLWKRYIDDIFTILPEEPTDFTAWLNSQHQSIKFTAETYNGGIAFLDTWITKTGRRLNTKVYTKPTDTKQYLSPLSCHPPHTFKSIPYSQALRIKRICTEEEDLQHELETLEINLTKRGYKTEDIKESYRRLEHPQQKPKQKKPTTLIVPYHPRNPRYQAIIQEVWNKHKDLLPAAITKPIVAFRRPKNLREILTKALYGKTIWRPQKEHSAQDQRRKYNQFQETLPHHQFTIGCPKNHSTMTEEYNNLKAVRQAAKDNTSTIYKTFCQPHEKCGQIIITPVKITRQIHIKCNECTYYYRYQSSKTIQRTTMEVYHANDCWSKGNLRRENKGNPCANAKCQTCPNHNTMGYITDNFQGTWYCAPYHCQTNNLIYCITCRKCNRHYIGLTTGTLNRRILQHKNSIKRKTNTGLSEHAQEHGWNVTVSILDSNPNWTKEDLQIREAIWIAMLRTINHGLNKKDEYHKHISNHTLYTVKHFNHSRTCLPYLTSNVTDVTEQELRPT